jgi:magnesium transporter
MADPETLTLAFVSAHPGEAARVLERMTAPEAAALFGKVPARAGAPVLTAMLPSVAARVIGLLEAKIALSMLTAAGSQAAVAVLRQVPEPKRSQLIEGLPTAAAIASRLLLGYPDDSVGAWADPDIVVLPPEVSVGEALARVRSGDEELVEQVFAVDREQRLVGLVDLHELLRVPEATAVASVMRKPSAVLTAIATLTGASGQRGWQQSAALPVVDRSGRLIGVLRRSTLARALARNRQQAPADEDASLAGVLARGYWDAISGLAEATVSLLPPGKPLYPGDQ